MCFALHIFWMTPVSWKQGKLNIAPVPWNKAEGGSEWILLQVKNRSPAGVSHVSPLEPDLPTLEQSYDCSHNNGGVYTNVMCPACFFSYSKNTGRRLNRPFNVHETVGDDSIASSVFLNQWASSQSSLQCFWNNGRRLYRLFSVSQPVGGESAFLPVFLELWVVSQ
jgi:hypothetical protein